MTLTLLAPNLHDGVAARLLLSLGVVSAHMAVLAALAALLVRLRAPSAAGAHALWRLALLGAPLSSAVAMVNVPGLAGADLAAPVHALLAPEAAVSVRAWVPLVQIAAVLGVASVLLGAARLVVSACALQRMLAGRAPVRDARLCARFAALCERAKVAGVALTESDRVVSPLVAGRREICLPRGLASFADDEVDAVLAHELAHLRRGDGVWFPLVAAVEALLWLQPLSGWLARRCRASAELAADDEAVALTRAPRSLARAITRMAAMQRAGGADMLPAMAGAHVALVRVRRLVEGDEERPGTGRSWLGCLAALVLILPCLRVEVATPRGDARGRATDVRAHRTQMLALAQRGAALEAALAETEVTSTDPAITDALAQDLRHLRATEAWLRGRTAPTVGGAASP